MLIFIEILIVVALSAFILTYLLFRKNITISRFKSDDSLDNYDIAFETIRFKTDDQVEIHSWFCLNNSQAPTILVCHGLGSSKHAMLVHASYLVRTGYNVLLFDFRAHGESGGQKTSFGYLEQNDFVAAIEYLKSREDLVCKKFGVLGESMGAAVSMMASVGYPEIFALCADGCYPELSQGFTNFMKRLGLPVVPFAFVARLFYQMHFNVSVHTVSPIDSVKKLSPRPLFFIVGTHDVRIPISDSERLFAAAKAPKHIWIIKNARHVEAHAIETVLYEQKVIEFFKKYLSID